MGGSFDFLLGSIQLPKTDIIRYRPRKQMRILQNNPQGTAQILFSNLPYVKSVVKDVYKRQD